MIRLPEDFPSSSPFDIRSWHVRRLWEYTWHGAISLSFSFIEIKSLSSLYKILYIDIKKNTGNILLLLLFSLNITKKQKEEPELLQQLAALNLPPRCFATRLACSSIVIFQSCHQLRCYHWRRQQSKGGWFGEFLRVFGNKKTWRTTWRRTTK